MPIALSPLDHRIIEWDHSTLVERACPLCEREELGEARYIRPDGLGVKECSRCGMFVVSPSPNREALNRFYDTYDQQHRRAHALATVELIAQTAKLDPMDDVRVCEITSLIELKGARVLDVGFGRGQMMAMLRSLGAEVHGVELDPKALRYARAIGIDAVTHGTIDDLPDETKFDLIIMNDVIEHPLDPLKMIQRAAALLKDDGLLLMWTPNGAASQREDEPVAFRVDLEHMQYFTPQSFVYLAAEVGLQLVQLSALGFPDIAGIEKPLPKSNPVKRLVRKVPGFDRVNALRRRLAPSRDLRCGDYVLLCILRKSRRS